MDISVLLFGYIGVFLRAVSTQGVPVLDIPVFLNSTYTFRRQTPVSSFLVLLVFPPLFQCCFDLSFIPSSWSFHTSFHSTIYRYTCLKTTVVTILTVSVRLLSIYRYVHCLYIIRRNCYLVVNSFGLYILYFLVCGSISNRILAIQILVFTTSKSLFSPMCS